MAKVKKATKKPVKKASEKKNKAKVAVKVATKPAIKAPAKAAKPIAKKVDVKTTKKVEAKPVVKTIAKSTTEKSKAKTFETKPKPLGKKIVTAPTPVKSASKIERPVPAYIENLPDLADIQQQNEKRSAHIPSGALFTEAELTTFLQLLKSEREKIMEKAKQLVEAGNMIIDKDEMYDEVDLASATVEQNLTFRLLDRDRKLLAEIDHAIDKVAGGEYGICEGTGEPIPRRRLELRPWTRHSVKYKEQLERMKKSGRGVVDEDELN